VPISIGTVAIGRRALLVLGIGNLLMGDEGVGVHAVRALENEELPPDARLMDGGTGGFHLLSAFREEPEIIIIDATLDGSPPGTVRVLEPRFASDFPRSLGAHDIGLRDLIEAAALLGPLPRTHLIAVSIERIGPPGTELSPRVAAGLPRVVQVALTLLAAGGPP
jgi:hydrogenase maturation protease